MKINHLAKEIKLYSQYATSDEWINWYAQVLPFKARRTIKILKNYKDKNAKLLDVGCSTGLTLGFMAREFKNASGCDVDSKAIAVAKKRFKKMGLKTKLFTYDGGKLPLKDNSVDIVTSIEVFEHVANPLAMLREICRVLKPDGILHITTANRLWPIEPHFHLFFLSYLPQKLADFYVRLSGRGKNYGKIKLPTYGQFHRAISRYFRVEDITLEVLQNYKEYDFEKERGKIILLIALFLRFFGRNKLVKKLLANLSLGWLFIAHPKK